MVHARLGEDAPLDTWSLVFDPEIAAQLSDCGIYIVDAADDMFPSALNYLGLPHDSRDPGEIEQAAELLSQMSANVRRFHASEYINALANGDICVAVGYSGDILQARDRAEEAGSGIGIAYFVPREGGGDVVRFVRHPGRCPQSGKRPRLHRFHAASRHRGGECQLRRLCLGCAAGQAR